VKGDRTGSALGYGGDGGRTLGQGGQVIWAWYGAGQVNWEGREGTVHLGMVGAGGGGATGIQYLLCLQIDRKGSRKCEGKDRHSVHLSTMGSIGI
jgi:hypothetical protein